MALIVAGELHSGIALNAGRHIRAKVIAQKDNARLAISHYFELSFPRTCQRWYINIEANYTSKELVLIRTKGQQNTNMNPERSAMIASAGNSPVQHRKSSLNPTMPSNPPMQSASNATSVAARRSFPLSPSTADARNTRMETDLISLFKRPCPSGTNPSIKGIGLYTHVEGPAGASPDPLGTPLQSEPVFLPLKKLTGSGTMVAPMREDIHKVWEELRDAVVEEGFRIGKTELGLEELKKRYGGLDAPSVSRARKKLVKRQQNEASQEEGEIRDGTASAFGRANSVANGRRPSLEAVMDTLSAKSRDMAMGGTEPDRGRTTEVTSTTSATFYAPDPRKQGR